MWWHIKVIFFFLTPTNMLTIFGHTKTAKWLSFLKALKLSSTQLKVRRNRIFWKFHSTSIRVRNSGDLDNSDIHPTGGFLSNLNLCFRFLFSFYGISYRKLFSCQEGPGYLSYSISWKLEIETFLKDKNAGIFSLTVSILYRKYP